MMFSLPELHATTVVIAVVAIVALWALLAYNRLVRLRNEADQGFANIESQLRRRADLVPNLVEVVKGYAAHESSTLSAVTAARDATLLATGQQQAAAADGLMQQATGRLMALAESYPDLKASASFGQLQQQLSDTEDRIAGVRSMFNVVVRRYNTTCEQFPSSLIARAGDFARRDLYRIEDEAQRAPVAVRLEGDG